MTILDASEYAESIRLTDSQRHAGIQIITPEQATLRSNDQGAVIMVRGVPKVSVQGLRIVATQAQVGIEVNGACPGLRLEDIKIDRVANADGSSINNAALALRNGAAGSSDEPIIVRRLSVRGTIVGVAIVSSDVKSASPRHIIIEESFIEGLSRETSTLLALLRGSEDITIRRNIFARGLQGLSVLTEEEASPLRCQIEQNTWHDIKTWIAWAGAAREGLSVRIRHNLIVDSHGISPAVPAVLFAYGRAGVCRRLSGKCERARCRELCPIRKRTAELPHPFPRSR